MDAYPNGTRIFFWAAQGNIEYGTMQSTSRLADGTQVVVIALDGGEGHRSLPASTIATSVLSCITEGFPTQGSISTNDHVDSVALERDAHAYCLSSLIQHNVQPNDSYIFRRPTNVYAHLPYSQYQSNQPSHPPGSIYGAENHAVVSSIPQADMYNLPDTRHIYTVRQTPEGPFTSQRPLASCCGTPCGWRDGGAGARICGTVIQCPEVPEHFKLFHNIVDIKASQLIECQWCFVACKRKNLVRHIRECHLGHIRNGSNSHAC